MATNPSELQAAHERATSGWQSVALRGPEASRETAVVEMSEWPIHLWINVSGTAVTTPRTPKAWQPLRPVRPPSSPGGLVARRLCETTPKA